MIVLLYLFPWLFGWLMDEPYGYLYGVGGVGGILSLFSLAMAGAEIIVDGRWRFAGVCVYGFFLAWIFTP